MASQRKKPAIGAKAPYLGFIERALATSIDKVPSGARCLHEIKFGGYRVQVHVRDGTVRIFTRRGNDWTKRFRKIAVLKSTPGLRSSMGKSWSLDQMAPATSLCCRMS